MGHLNTLFNKYKDRGFTLLAVTDEGRGLVDAFVAKNSPAYPIVLESSDSATSYGITGFPSAFLIGPDGKIAWSGNSFNESAQGELLEKLLSQVRLTPDLPKALDPIEKLLEKKKFAEARAALAKVAASESADAGDRKAAEDTIKWIDDGAASALSTAAEDEKAGRVAEAGAVYERLVSDYAGLEPAGKAGEALKALLADPAKKKEVDGAKALAAAQEKIRDLSPKKAIPIIKAVWTKYKDTKAGARAQQLLAELEKQANR